jgi:alkylated DNA repair dioxygenase AlkB
VTAMKQHELFSTVHALALEGLSYEPRFIEESEEHELLGHIAQLELREAQYKAYQAKRRIVSYGGHYDFDRHELTPSGSVPEFLYPLRARVARWAGLPAESFAHALISEYRPGTQLGWHRDVPEFECIGGVSLLGPCRMRFKTYPSGRSQRMFELELAPRSAYLLQGAARWEWQHSVAPTPALRYSITFRTRRAATSATADARRGDPA